MRTSALKIKLVRSPILNVGRVFEGRDSHEVQLYPPASLGYLAAYLRGQGVEVDLDDLDIKFFRYVKTASSKMDLLILCDEQRAIKRLAGHKDPLLEQYLDSIIDLTGLEGVELFCFSVERRLQYKALILPLLLAARIRERYRGIKIVMGGGAFDIFDQRHEDVFCNDLLRLAVVERKSLDYYIFGPGEKALHALIEALVSGGEVSGVPGIFYVEEGKIISNPPLKGRELIKPDFDGLPLDLYRWGHRQIEINDGALRERIRNDKDGDEGLLILPFILHNGCPFKCAFCMSGDSSVYSLDPVIAAQYLEELSQKYNTPYFIFFNDNFNISRDYAERFCDEVLRRGLKIFWKDCATSKGLDRALLTKMKACGCISLIFGFETGSSRLQDYIGKRLDLQHLSGILKDAYELNIWTELEVIPGLPTETDEDIAATVRFIKADQQHVNVFYVSPFCLVPHSKFSCYPEKYQLVNVGPLQRASLAFAAVHERMWFTYEEASGKKWCEIRRCIEVSSQKVQMAIPLLKRDALIPDYSEHVNVLFLLYRYFRNDKRRIEKAYYSLFMWKGLRSKILYVLSAKGLCLLGARKIFGRLQLYIVGGLKYLWSHKRVARF